MALSKKDLEQIDKTLARHIKVVKEDIQSRIKVIGEQYSFLSKQAAETQKEILKIQEDIALMKLDILKIQKDMDLMKLDMQFIKAELKKFTREEEFEVLEKRIAILERKVKV